MSVGYKRCLFSEIHFSYLVFISIIGETLYVVGCKWGKRVIFMPRKSVLVILDHFIEVMSSYAREVRKL